jgi:hypothetical protein
MKKLPKRTKYFYDQFVNSANKQILHPLDWKRFYVFIQAAHEGRTNLLENDLEELLIANGFQPDMAKCLSYVYHHGRELLKSRLMLHYKYKP